ncbi:hypothetical protein [Chryseobacterium koreense]|uniref:Uncharacterized protein n=1 Tax=Chryseobacterium koreense CCUG 49689 TaxID=1304281 RepID=A0A0J7IWU8_9FLAO|nr:hypothetical protein [Chryseobacterium koreense]KMQ70284.1 hypothetical protein ACM44_13215 [Chryseobacterium koreense CCUG 49689]MBB5332593.1 hypothetical protein [Chryseobacterium koreense]
METIKTFIQNFLQAEATASDALVKPNLEDYNQKLEIMNSFCVPELHNKFGMMPRRQLWSDELYENWKDAPSANPRLIYKISQYQDANYGAVYVVYVSGSNPNEMFYLYGECVFVATINEELKIVKNYTFGDDMLIKKKFETPQGLADISFETLKKPISIERYLKPEDDEDAMEHYETDI